MIYIQKDTKINVFKLFIRTSKLLYLDQGNIQYHDRE